jgi:hypothetical protein
LEAGSEIGGRVKQNYSFLKGGKPIDLGAELVHGDDTVLTQFGEKEKWLFHELFCWAQGDGGPQEEPATDGGVGYYYMGKEKKLMRFDGLDADIEHLHEVLDAVGDEELLEDKQNLEEYLREKGVAERVISLADAGFANTAATGKVSNMSVARCIDAEKSWE